MSKKLSLFIISLISFAIFAMAPKKGPSESEFVDIEAGLQPSKFPLTAYTVKVGQTLHYEDIAKQNLKSIAGKQELKIPVTTGGNVEKFIERQKTILLNITDRVKMNITFSILGNNEKNNPIMPAIIDQTTWRDLNLLNGPEQNPETYLGSILSKTNTALGKSYFLGTIARPIAHAKILEKRQRIIKDLTNNTKLLHDLTILLKKMAEGEGQLLSFWDNGLQLPGTIMKQYWTINKNLDEILNNSKLALDLKSTWNTSQKCMATGIQATSALFLTAYSLSALINEISGIESTPASLQFLETYATRFTGTSGPMYAVVSSISPWLQCSASLAAGIFNGLGLKSTIDWTRADLSIEAILQKKLVAVAAYTQTMKEINDLFKKHPDFSTSFEQFSNLGNALEDPDIKHLFDTLGAKTFTEESSYFFSRGNVLLAYRLLHEKKIQNELEKALAAIAEIDMFTSIATLYNQFKNNRITFCFPTYSKRKTPFIDLKNYWNPFVDPKVAVDNSTVLGKNTQTRNGIITGPNSAGKTTVLKSIALSIILAQSIGIAPAAAMNVTPFSHVATYMDISDDISNKTSLFQSEVDRAITLQKTIENLPKGAFSFSIFDELFSGTSPNEGMAMAYATAEEIGTLKNSICMIATHYHLLTNLATETNYFTNYKVAVEQGKQIKRLYKLEPDISEQHIAIDVARERGITGNILDRAAQILKQIETQ